MHHQHFTEVFRGQEADQTLLRIEHAHSGFVQFG
jgi:hypothetical protein